MLSREDTALFSTTFSRWWGSGFKTARDNNVTPAPALPFVTKSDNIFLRCFLEHDFICFQIVSPSLSPFVCIWPDLLLSGLSRMDPPRYKCETVPPRRCRQAAASRQGTQPCPQLSCPWGRRKRLLGIAQTPLKSTEKLPLVSIRLWARLLISQYLGFPNAKPYRSSQLC